MYQHLFTTTQYDQKKTTIYSPDDLDLHRNSHQTSSYFITEVS